MHAILSARAGITNCLPEWHTGVRVAGWRQERPRLRKVTQECRIDAQSGWRARTMDPDRRAVAAPSVFVGLP